MKIAAATDDGKTISQHFGRAAYYLVLTVGSDRIMRREKRDKREAQSRQAEMIAMKEIAKWFSPEAWAGEHTRG